MIKKIFLVAVVVGSISITYLLWFGALLPFHQQAAEIAINGSAYSNNMTGLVPAVESSPMWMSIIPAAVGVIVIIMILRAPEKR